MPDLFEINNHGWIHVKKSNIDAFCAFGITMHFICKYLFKVLSVLLFPLRSCWGSIQPCVITASGDSGYSTKCFYGHGVMTLLHGIVDYFKNTVRIVHEQCTCFLVVLIEEIFLRTPFPVSGNLLLVAVV